AVVVIVVGFGHCEMNAVTSVTCRSNREMIFTVKFFIVRSIE
ncbi:MAG: hypothetical protein ACI8RD_014825, partial [Bacillariaceae sp.]